MDSLMKYPSSLLFLVSIAWNSQQPQQMFDTWLCEQTNRSHSILARAGLASV